MTFRKTLTAALMAVLALSPSIATAQFYGGGCSACGSAPVAVAPARSACYETVPVTAYKREKQTVQVPYYKTAYEEQEITYYEPVTRKRTVEVPTVSYKTVVENRTVHRDLGRWQTSYQPIQKPAPCQVDPRPGLLGWLNRTGYSFQSAFTPNYRTTRQYVPRVIACNVPVTRQVAVRGTKKVVVTETQMVAKTRKERVPVKKLAWREETVTVARPVTAWRTVPIGSALAYGGFYGAPGASIAYIEEDDDDVKSARRPVPDENFSEGRRSARGTEPDTDNYRSGDRTFRRDDDVDDGQFQRSSFNREVPAEEPVLQPPRSLPPGNNAPAAPDFQDFSTKRSRGNDRPQQHITRTTTSGGWKPARRNNENQTADAKPHDSELLIPAVRLTRR